MKIKSILLFILLPFFAISQFSEKKVYEIKKTVIKPKIDGVVNDEVWKNLNSANNFTQFKPNNGLLERPTHKTEVKICYDNQNIYFIYIINSSIKKCIFF